jgi:hypothetical protein
MDYKTILIPYLIQRGKFRDLSEDQIVGLDSLIDYDYMGSSEFEWGALPRSLKNMTSNWKDFITFQIDSIKDNDGNYLQVLCNKNEAEEVKDVIIKLFDKDCKIRLKEWSGMYDYLSCRSEYALKTNFWWDVTGNDYPDRGESNSWMCCFGSNIRSLIIAVRKVWCKHNKSDALPEIGPEVPALISKSKPSQLLIEADRNQIRVTTVSGRKTVINKKAIQDFSVYTDRLEVTVKNKAGLNRVLNVQAEASNQRKVLENMLTEQKEWLCHSK